MRIRPRFASWVLLCTFVIDAKKTHLCVHLSSSIPSITFLNVSPCSPHGFPVFSEYRAPLVIDAQPGKARFCKNFKPDPGKFFNFPHIELKPSCDRNPDIQFSIIFLVRVIERHQHRFDRSWRVAIEVPLCCIFMLQIVPCWRCLLTCHFSLVSII